MEGHHPPVEESGFSSPSHYSCEGGANGRSMKRAAAEPSAGNVRAPSTSGVSYVSQPLYGQGQWPDAFARPQPQVMGPPLVPRFSQPPRLNNDRGLIIDVSQRTSISAPQHYVLPHHDCVVSEYPRPPMAGNREYTGPSTSANPFQPYPHPPVYKSILRSSLENPAFMGRAGGVQEAAASSTMVDNSGAVPNSSVRQVPTPAVSETRSRCKRRRWEGDDPFVASSNKRTPDGFLTPAPPLPARPQYCQTRNPPNKQRVRHLKQRKSENLLVEAYFEPICASHINRVAGHGGNAGVGTTPASFGGPWASSAPSTSLLGSVNSQGYSQVDTLDCMPELSPHDVIQVLSSTSLQFTQTPIPAPQGNPQQLMFLPPTAMDWEANGHFFHVNQSHNFPAPFPEQPVPTPHLSALLTSPIKNEPTTELMQPLSYGRPMVMPMQDVQEGKTFYEMMASESPQASHSSSASTLSVRVGGSPVVEMADTIMEDVGPGLVTPPLSPRHSYCSHQPMQSQTLGTGGVFAPIKPETMQPATEGQPSLEAPSALDES